MMMYRSEAVLTMMSNAESVSVTDIEGTGINLKQRWPIFNCIFGGGVNFRFWPKSGWSKVSWSSPSPPYSFIILMSLEYENRYEVTDNAIETIKKWRSPSGEKIFQSKLRFQIRFANYFEALCPHLAHIPLGWMTSGSELSQMRTYPVLILGDSHCRCCFYAFQQSFL